MDIRKILFKTCELDTTNVFPDAVLVCNKDGSIVWFNDKAESIFVRLANNTQVSEYIEGGLNMITSALLLGKPLQVKKVSEELYYDMSVRENEDVYVLSFRESIVTTTEEQNEDYKVINRDKNNFLIKLANDFKSPLQSIIGFSQAISDGLGGEVSVQQDKYIKIIKKNSTELMYFVEKLMMLSKTETEHITPNKKIFDILNCVKMLAKYNMQICKEKDIKITIEAEENLKNTFISDEDIIKQVVQNIIEVIQNAVEMGEIIIRLVTPTEEVCQKMNIKNDSLLLSISCTSLLLTENEIENIFDPYKIIDSSNRKNLLRAIIMSAVRNLVQAIGGQIWAESRPLKETGFYILLSQNEE